MIEQMNEIAEEMPQDSRSEEDKGFARSSSDTPPKNVHTLNRKFLINKLNHLNFSAIPVELLFCSSEFAHTRSVMAHPQPCSSERCDFVWAEKAGPEGAVPSGYQLDSIRINLEDQQLIVIEPEDYQMGPEGLTFILPKQARIFEVDPEISETAKDITCTVSQSGIAASGELVSFSESALMVRLRDSAGIRWIEGDYPVHVTLSNSEEPVYSEICRVDSAFSSRSDRCFSLGIGATSVRRYRSRQFRSSRKSLEMSPRVSFRHPLSGRTIERRIGDLSGSGFSFLDEKGTCRLPAGLIIPRVELFFPDYADLKVKAQVIHHTPDSTEGSVRYGLCILDIDPQDHLVLLSLVHQSFDIYASLCKKVDLERLWRFFFESGFIYPEKYTLLQRQKEEIRASFEKLYTQRNNVARHFIYQKDDDILGHLSMVRFYERTWLLHHHASAGMRGRNAGISVLHQVGSYVNDSCRFGRMNLDYMMCYFRRENHFPNRIFGGLVDYAKDRKICSDDEVAYCSLRSESTDLREDPLWSLEEANEDDYIRLNCFYEEVSGGLLLNAMHLPPFADLEISNREVREAYRELGILRDIQVRALKHNGRLTAIFIVNRSDTGINLSELTNSTTLFLLKPELISKEILSRAFTNLCREGVNSLSPVLVFPRESADKVGVEYEKIYVAWVMDTMIGDKYFEHIQSILRTVKP
ncbi:PilZ domain-containing protein [Marispirochaeta aestuarii]|uniref:PilZ domain-containing protein n=1 Tax=Marispirochaeta aestuarii TaxID=1963862 RepID=UPI002ABE72A0|nr:PilZ domain-containing protein [Marispirochaeta aestuarii]